MIELRNWWSSFLKDNKNMSFDSYRGFLSDRFCKDAVSLKKKKEFCYRIIL